MIAVTYNKRGEKIFFMIIDFALALAMIVLMIYEWKANIFFIIISIVYIFKGIYNFISLKKF